MAVGNDMLTALGQTVDDDGLEEALRSAADETLADGEPRDPEPSAAAIPERIGRYTVIRRLGAGTMGVVYEAHDEQVDRRVALKLLRGRGAETERVRLMREAQALAQLSHPNVVNVFEVGTLNEHAYLVMELVEGTSLDRWLQDEPRTVREILDVFVQAGQGLAAAHDAGFVHRDFKPGNVLVGADGRVRVLDFGLARAHSGPFSGEHAASPSPMSIESLPRVWGHDLTHAGAVLGTPAYMSPEQLGTEPVTAKSDQFAFCVALHEAVYQQHPFIEDGQMQELLHNILYDQRRPPPERPDVPARVRSALQRGLSSEPQARWPSMPELLHELEVAQRTSGWTRRAAVGAAIVMAGLGGVWALLDAPRDDDALACTGADAKLAEVWGPSQRATMQHAFSATQLSYAEQTWERVGPLLDTYSARWASSFAQACEAGPDDAQQLDRRMACLERLRHALGTQVEILASPDAAVIQRAVTAIRGLQRPEHCLEPDADPSTVPPEDPQLAARVEVIDQDLERVDALERSGRYDDALRSAVQAVSVAQTLGYPPLEARALLRQGKIRQKLGAYEQAQQELERAYFLAQQSGLHSIAREAAVQLVQVIGVDQQDYERGLEWSRHAEVEVERDADPVIRGGYLGHVGLVLMRRGEYEDARLTLQQGLEELQSGLDPGDPEIATALGNIGIVLRKLLRTKEAIEHQEQALAIYEESLGPGHPLVAQTLANLAAALYFDGRVEEAVQMSQRSLAIEEAALGPGHLTLANGLANQSLMLSDLGRFEEAEQSARRAVDLLEQAGTQPHSLCAALANLAYVQQRAGRLEDAAHNLARVVAELEELGLGEHPDTVQALVNHGDVLEQLHRLEQSEAVLRKALAILDHSSSPSLQNTIRAHGYLGKVSLSAGRFDEATEHIHRALELLPPGDPKPFRAAWLRLLLAKAQWGTGRSTHDQALANAREAARLAATLDSSDRAQRLSQEIQAWRTEHDPAVAPQPP